MGPGLGGGRGLHGVIPRGALVPVLGHGRRGLKGQVVEAEGAHLREGANGVMGGSWADTDTDGDGHAGKDARKGRTESNGRNKLGTGVRQAKLDENGLDLTAPDRGMRRVPTELWVRQQRIYRAAHWTVPNEPQFPCRTRVACRVGNDGYFLTLRSETTSPKKPPQPPTVHRMALPSAQYIIARNDPLQRAVLPGPQAPLQRPPADTEPDSQQTVDHGHLRSEVVGLVRMSTERCGRRCPSTHTRQGQVGGMGSEKGGLKRQSAASGFRGAPQRGPAGRRRPPLRLP